MRSIPLLAATSVILAAAWSCGGGGTDVTAPVANFTVGSCTAGTACQFTNTSTPASGLTYDWDFGDNTSPHVTDQSPAHIYAAAGTYSVVLTVKDGSSATNAKTLPITVAGPAGPAAAFTVQCDGPACSFTDGSTPAGALTYQWDFGEPSSGANNTSTTPNPTHSYTVTAVTPFTVTLKVTDASGASATTTQGITVTPPAQLSCGAGTGGQCTINLTQRSSVTFTLTTRDCQLGGNRLSIVQPVAARQTIFFNGCSEPAGKVYNISNGAAFDANTQLLLQFTQGAGKPTDPPRGPPLLRLSGGFPNWTLEIDDGGNFGAPGEPDYNDLVLAIHATP
jgi:PKD repeat protein